MKILFLTCFLVISISFGIAQQPKGKIQIGVGTWHWENPDYLNGKVKEIHYASFNVIEKNGELVKVNPVKYSDMRLWEMQPHTIYFNEAGDILKEYRVINNVGYVGIFHSENGKIKSIYWLRNDTLVGRQDFLYKGNAETEIQNRRIDNNGLMGKEVFNFNDKGFLTQHTTYNSKGKVTGVLKHELNPDGRMIRRTQTDTTGNITYDYDKYKYNDQGEQISIHRNVHRGEKVDVTSTLRTTYKYDEKNNWILKISGDKKTITERKIVYYKE
jgi:hypothetical protein